MMDTLRTGSRGCTDVAFKNGTSMEALPEGPDNWIWLIKLDTWCWTKFVTCSKWWNKACTGFSDMLPEIQFEERWQTNQYTKVSKARQIIESK